MTDEELKQEIEKVKQKIADYTRIAPLLGITPEEKEKQINLMLDDLSKLLKEVKTTGCPSAGILKTLSYEKCTRYFSRNETANGFS